MQRDDLPAVIVVEKAAYQHPWSSGIFRDCLRAGYCNLVLEHVSDDHYQSIIICGHGIMMLTTDECHILNLCIHPDYQRRGLGRILLRRLLALAQQRHAMTAFLEVRVSNGTAIALYQAEGFNEVGYRRNYYPTLTGREDALVMARAL
ncbi:ribosomal protein S18-alanine N-acetyltransferase [Thiospirillum jenense]|uniref:[Ribosomal protein bS18]-alanine N-acetyltransferase n=2 Tax=Thiospirillum jenense TaxID=1653858 RepID=A0A839HAS9_9GAMM|nr:ribosomal protein S18-alanine N-acetyltransferase [Thiospirillum jenense]MBB1125360.1 ribosomal protein S18-alanine N-acetyltransferase [Thiospirillum jenense]